MFSTDSTAERIYKFSGKYVIISVASKYLEVLIPRKHTVSSLT